MKTFFALLFSLFAFLAAGCGDNSDSHDEEMIDHMEETEMNDYQDNEMMEGEHAILDSSVIRDQNVNVASIDKNGDGMVYQCPMDHEVISDEFGRCPLCKMDLKAVTVEAAKENLLDN